MATYDFPLTVGIASMEWGVQKSGTQFRGPYNGTLQAVNFVADRYVVSLTLALVPTVKSGQIEALFSALTGGVDRLRLWHRTRPVPIGSMRGSPTLVNTVTRGASSMTLKTQPFDTLLAGDLFKLAGQVFQALFDTKADASGNMVVQLVLRVRSQINAGTFVVWDRPTAEFTLPAMTTRFSYAPAIMNGLGVELEEVY